MFNNMVNNSTQSPQNQSPVSAKIKIRNLTLQEYQEFLNYFKKNPKYNMSDSSIKSWKIFSSADPATTAPSGHKPIFEAQINPSQNTLSLQIESYAKEVFEANINFFFKSLNDYLASHNPSRIAEFIFDLNSGSSTLSAEDKKKIIETAHGPYKTNITLYFEHSFLPGQQTSKDNIASQSANGHQQHLNISPFKKINLVK